MSIPTEKVNYQGNPIVSVRIVSIHPSRLVVSLPDRRRGYIYKNDWSWDDSVRSEPNTFRVGQKTEAVLISGRSAHRSQRLSLRHVIDPWADTAVYRIGQHLKTEIIYIRKNSVYVQLKPGITAIIHSRDIPLLHDQLPEDRLVVGDIVWGTIIDILPAKKRITMSLLLPLQQAKKDWEIDLKYTFQQQLINLLSSLSSKKVKAQYSTEYHFLPPLKRLRSVLLVEDSKWDSRIVSDLLERELRVNVAFTSSTTAALAQLEKKSDYDLVLTDMNLQNDNNGIFLLNEIRRLYPEQAVALMSSNHMAEFEVRNYEEKYGSKILFLEKPATKELADSFIEGLKLLQKGKVKIRQRLDENKDERLLTSLRQQLQRKGSRADKLAEILRNLCLINNLTYAFLLEVDSDRKMVEVASQYHTAGDTLLPEQVDNLYFSAVRDIAEDESVLYLAQKEDIRRPFRLHNFFPGIQFQSCYGLPISVPLSEKHYALVILDDARDISRNSITQIKTAAAYVGMTLEQDDMLKIVRKQQDLALQGTLMGTLLHELNNRLNPLFEFLETVEEYQEENKKEEFWEYLGEVGPDLQRIKELTRAYTRLAKFELEQVAVNTILEKVKQQLLPYAQDKGITLIVEEDKRQPKIWGIPIHLEQVLTNVVLNAIQWVEEQNSQWHQINRSHGLEAANSLHARRQIKISACQYPQQNTCCILIADEGPGIPYSHREKIFSPHVSQRRNGQGLGLYISRDLAEAMYGSLVYVDSIRFIGSLFALLFPIANPQNHGNQT